MGIVNLYCFAVRAGFHSDTVQCLPRKHNVTQQSANFSAFSSGHNNKCFMFGRFPRCEVNAGVTTLNFHIV